MLNYIKMVLKVLFWDFSGALKLFKAPHLVMHFVSLVILFVIGTLEIGLEDRDDYGLISLAFWAFWLTLCVTTFQFARDLGTMSAQSGGRGFPMAARKLLDFLPTLAATCVLILLLGLFLMEVAQVRDAVFLSIFFWMLSELGKLLGGPHYYEGSKTGRKAALTNIPNEGVSRQMMSARIDAAGPSIGRVFDFPIPKWIRLSNGQQMEFKAYVGANFDARTMKESEVLIIPGLLYAAEE